ncbi:MAG: MATE family efflux transporter [Bacteroidetes bacterium]|nr:MATE family efflux transporter [Bacteroidota bacterium]MDA1337114.1 MATE family efflux transporter [Bacteroidota bacterium]
MNTTSKLNIGYSDLIRMALPISLGTMLQFFVLLTDNFFLSRLSENAINGAGNAGLVYLTLQMVAVGSGAALQIVIARKIGQGDTPSAQQTFRTGLVIHLMIGLVLTVLAIVLEKWLLLNVIQDPGIRQVFNEFFAIRMIGFIPFSVLLAFNALYTGTAKTWPILVVGIVCAGTNIFLDAAWVEGWWGFTPIGAVGAAWASLISEVLGLVMGLLITVIFLPKALLPWSLLSKKELVAWWKLAYPLIGQFLITISTWTAFFFFVEKVGGMELKVSHIARNLFMLAFIISQGMQQTTRTYVSGLLGEERLNDLSIALKRIVKLNFIGILMLCHGFILYPNWIASFFFDDAVGQLAMTQTLYVIFSAVCIYAFTGIMLSTIQGSGRTKIAFSIELAAVTLYMLVATSLTLIWPQPVWIIWRVEWAYFSMIGLGSWFYLRSGNWKSQNDNIIPT